MRKSPVPAATSATRVSTEDLKILPDFVKFCKQENIAFTDSERLLFDINLTKRGHRLYTKCIDKAYKQSGGPYKDRLDTYLLDDAEIARLQVERAEVQ